MLHWRSASGVPAIAAAASIQVNSVCLSRDQQEPTWRTTFRLQSQKFGTYAGPKGVIIGASDFKASLSSMALRTMTDALLRG